MCHKTSSGSPDRVEYPEVICRSVIFLSYLFASLGYSEASGVCIEPTNTQTRAALDTKTRSAPLKSPKGPSPGSVLFVLIRTPQNPRLCTTPKTGRGSRDIPGPSSFPVQLGVKTFGCQPLRRMGACGLELVCVDIPLSTRASERFGMPSLGTIQVMSSVDHPAAQ